MPPPKKRGGGAPAPAPFAGQVPAGLAPDAGNDFDAALAQLETDEQAWREEQAKRREEQEERDKREEQAQKEREQKQLETGLQLARQRIGEEQQKEQTKIVAEEQSRRVLREAKAAQQLAQLEDAEKRTLEAKRLSQLACCFEWFVRSSKFGGTEPGTGAQKRTGGSRPS